MAFDFQTLQTIQPFDAITLRVPARWHCGPKEGDNNRWVCGEDPDTDLETGTLWIQLDGFLVEPEDQPASEPDHFAFARDFIAEFDHRGQAVENKTVAETDREVFWTYEDTAVEAGELLRFYWHRRFMVVPAGTIIILSNLVIAEADKDKPEYVDLVRLIEDEIRTADFVPPPHWMEKNFTDAHISALSDHCIVNFENQVKIEVPDRMEDVPTKETTRHWTLSFPDDAPQAEATVELEFHSLADGEAAARMEEIRQSWPAAAQRTRMPAGWVGHRWADEPGSGDGWRGDTCRVHRWHHVIRLEGRLSVLHVTLRFPRQAADASPFPYLVALFSRNVRDAEFMPPTPPVDWQSPALELKRTPTVPQSSARIPADWIRSTEGDTIC